jgi:hypothetical protein
LLTLAAHAADGSGSERFVRWLDEVGRARAPPARCPRHPAPTRRARARTRGSSDALARACSPFAVRAPRSLAGPLRRIPQRLELDLETFTPAETERVAEARAGWRALTPMLFIWPRASARTTRCFGCAASTRAAVVPLPVNLRAKGTGGRCSARVSRCSGSR